MTITFATPENMTTFWGFVQTLLGFAQPWIMIAFAILAVGFLLVIIVNSFRQAAKKDEEEEIDLRHY